jgi:DNA (cytosine-5)-methyltransferase 1
MTRPRLLDLFCGAGGAAVGYHRAGFEVIGVDIKPQPRYPFRFIQGNALDVLGYGHGMSDAPFKFDLIHASPPCQAFTALRTAWNAKPHEDLLTPTRECLIKLGVPFVIENVPGSPMTNNVTLCGTMFGLGVGNAELRRHRLFETSWAFAGLMPRCGHGQRPITIGVYGQHGRDRRRSVQTFFSVEDGKVAMGIDWMKGDELSQSIPPAYTEFIGKEWLREQGTVRPRAETFFRWNEAHTLPTIEANP